MSMEYPALRRMHTKDDVRECPECGAATGESCLEPDWTEIRWFACDDHEGRRRGYPLKKEKKP